AANWHKAGSEGLAAFSYQQIGDVQLSVGNPRAALTAYRSSLKILEELSRNDPHDTGWRHGRAVAEAQVGDALAAAGETSQALSAYRRSLEVAAALAAADPGNDLWRKDMATAQERIDKVLGRPHRGQRRDQPATSSADRDRTRTRLHCCRSGTNRRDGPRRVGLAAGRRAVANRSETVSAARFRCASSLPRGSAS